VVSTVSLVVAIALVALFMTRRASRQSIEPIQLNARSSAWPAAQVELRPIIRARITLPYTEQTGAQAAGGCSLALLPAPIPAHYTIQA